MALIMYLTKAPRYQNILTDEYETISREDIVLVDKYFNWKKAREEGQYSCDTLEEWCGIHESRLPHKYVVNYYRDFYVEKKMYLEYVGDVEVYSIFDQLARFAKLNQIFNWFIKNVMNGNVDQKYYEVTKEHLECLLDACDKVKNSTDENVAKTLLPIMEEKGYFFGVDSYDEIYTNQVSEVAEIIKNILETTDFNKETVYFNAIW